MAPEPLLRHIVLLQFTEAAHPHQVAELGRAFGVLGTSIGAIAELEWGHVINAPISYTHCLLVTFGSAADLEDYNNHPAHQVIATRYGHLVQQVAVYDYWTGEPLQLVN